MSNYDNNTYNALINKELLFIVHNHYHISLAHSLVKNLKHNMIGKVKVRLLVIDTFYIKSKVISNEFFSSDLWDEKIVIPQFKKIIDKKIFKNYDKNRQIRKIVNSYFDNYKPDFVFLFVDHEITSQYIQSLLKSSTKILIEEGLAIYNDREEFRINENKIVSRFIELIFKIFYFKEYKRISLGFNTEIDILLVNSPECIPKNKCNNKKVYKMPNKIYANMFKESEKCKYSNLYITQPISENKILTRDDEVNFIIKTTKLMEKYGASFTIKTHPVENVEKYLSLNGEYELIENGFMIEKLFSNLNVDTIFTIFSSSAINALSFDNICNVVFLFELMNQYDPNVREQFNNVFKFIYDRAKYDERIKIPRDWNEFEEILRDLK